jgi:hypothetical protein
MPWWIVFLSLAWLIFYFAPNRSARISGLGILLLILAFGLS